MRESLLVWIALFFGLSVLFTYFIGHAGFLGSIETIVVLVVAGILSYWLWRRMEVSIPTVKEKKWFWGILLLGAILLFLYLPDGIVGNTCSDIQNHTRSIRIGSLSGTIFTNPLDMDLSFSSYIPLHEAPILWLGIYVGINSVLYSTYQVSSVLSALFILLSVLGIFFIAREWFDEKVALASLFLGMFCIINFYLLSHGFLPQIVGGFGIIWAVYFWEKKKWIESGIMGAVGVAYPPFFISFAIYVLLRWWFNQDHYRLTTVASVLGISALLSLPEIIGLGLGRLPILIRQAGIDLIRGGVAVPNPILLIGFLPVVYGLMVLHRQKKWGHPLNLLLLSIGVGIAYVGGAFLLNLVTETVSIQIHRLYMAVKFFYFLLWPLSILGGVGLVAFWEKHRGHAKKIVVGLMVLHLLLYSGFLHAAPSPRENFPAPIYHIADALSLLPGPFTIGIDESLLENTYVAPYPYNPFFDNPDNGPGKCPLIEINRLMQFPWARHQLDWDEAYFRVVDDQNEWVVKYGDVNADYYITDQPITGVIPFMSEGDISVYKDLATEEKS